MRIVKYVFLLSLFSFAFYLLLFFHKLPSITWMSSLTPLSSHDQQAMVTKVVDSDTINVTINGGTETVRLLGLDAPETLDPRKPVECFGKEAAEKLSSLVSNDEVRLESYPS